jgi:NADPH-dependent 2,4-dienoyl-CoA reductase/sulfur reductase-like enzyme
LPSAAATPASPPRCARELDPTSDVTVVVADAYPNFSICGIPYYISGEVTHWRNLAHRSYADLEATGMQLQLDTTATTIDIPGHRIAIRDRHGAQDWIDYDELVVGTGALPVHPPITGLDRLGPADGVHVLHSMGDTFALTHTIDTLTPRTALIVGAGYVGLEMAEGLTARGLSVTQVEMLPEVLSTVDPELGALIHAELARQGVGVHTRSTVTAITRTPDGPARLHVEGTGPDTQPQRWDVDLVLVVVGVRPDTDLLVTAGAKTGPRGAVLVDETMATGLPHVWAAGDCVATHHRLLGLTYLPLGTTAHKQGRIAGENALGGTARFAGSLGTQVVKVFDLVAARTGLREHEASTAGYAPVTTQSAPDDHKAYYPGASPIAIRITGDQASGRLLGAQLIGARGTETAKRVDTYATALHHHMTVDELSELDPVLHPTPWLALGRRPSRRTSLGPRTPALAAAGRAAPRRTRLMTATVHGAGRGVRPWQLARLVAAAAGACSAHIDEHYQLTAIVVQRHSPAYETQTVVVELVHDRRNAEHRWTAMAIDELRQIETPLSHGHTAKAAINGIAWSALDT